MSKPRKLTAHRQEFIYLDAISEQLSRIETLPKAEIFRFKGRLVFGYLPRTALAADYCEYFKPDQHKPLTLNSTNLKRIEKSIDRFLARIS